MSPHTSPPVPSARSSGPSGAGKTTLANLVPRFYDVTTGKITIDQIDVRAMRMADLRQHRDRLPDPVLNDTIYNNLLVTAEATRDEVLAATRDASAHDFIANILPRATIPLWANAVRNFPAGKSNASPLRAPSCATPPFSSSTTSPVPSTARARPKGAEKPAATVLIIAHRFSTIRDASMILVFNNGRIIGQGNHPELYHSSTLYKFVV